MGGIVGPSVLKFSLAAGALSFQADVDRHPAQIVLDPAVTMSAVSAKYAQSLHLRHIGHATIQAGGTRISGDTTEAVTVRMGGAFFRIPSLLVAKLADLSRIAGSADLVIGADTLDRTTLAIDFEHGRVNAIADGDLRRATRGFVAVALTKGAAGERHMRVRFGAGPALDAIVDLGSPAPVLMSESVLAALALPAGRPTSTGLMATPSGPQPTVTFSLPEMTVEGTVVHDVPAEAAAAWTAPAPVVVGLDLFEQYRLVLDLGHDRLWLQPGPPKPFDRDLIGLTLAQKSDALEILHVADHSPAAAAGLRVGGTITEIDGKKIDDRYFSSDLWRWRFGPAGKSVMLTVDGAKIELVMARFD